MPMFVREWTQYSDHHGGVKLMVELKLKPMGFVLSPEVAQLYKEFMWAMGGSFVPNGNDEGLLSSEKLLMLSQKMFEIEHAEKKLG